MKDRSSTVKEKQVKLLMPQGELESGSSLKRAAQRKVSAGLQTSLLLLALGAATSHAQETAARLTGTATDSSGAIVANATVILTNENTKAEVTRTITDQRGEFSALQLPPGKYTISIQAPGFKAVSINGVELTIAQALDLPVALQIGSQSDVVEVSGEQPQLENGTAMISTAITPEQVSELPLPNRDVTQLFALVPGVVQGGDPTSYNSAQLSISGSRTLNTEVLVDGISAINGATGGINRLPSPDFISEFRVIASTAPAEYGRTSGAVITIGTRSGTSQYHGTVYELFQNNVLNANSYFNKLQAVTVPRAIDDYNQFGVAFGGPVRIPHLYDGRKKTFFFLNYDQTVNRNSGQLSFTLPGGPSTTGDFSALTASAIILDPKTGVQFPGNKIPASRIDPAAARIIAALPTLSAGTNNYFTQQALARIDPMYSGRIDQQFGDKTRFFGSVTRQINPSPQVVGVSAALNPSYSNDDSNGWESALGLTQQLSSTLVLNLGFGAERATSHRVPTSNGIDPTATFGIGTAPAQQIPQLAITGYTTLGAANGTNLKSYSNSFVYFGSIIKVLGAHTLKFGSTLRKNQLNVYNPSVPVGGLYGFTGDITSKGTATNNQYNSLADFLLGAVKTASYGFPQPETGRRNYNIGVYGQDDFKILPNLLLSAGLRWEYESPLVIASDVYSRVDPGTGVLLLAGQNASRSLNITTPKLDFAPRVGLIWSVYPKTVVRAGYGSYYGLIFSNLGGQVTFPGYENTQAFLSQGTGIAQPFTLSQGMPLIGTAGRTNPNLVFNAGTPTAPFTVGGGSFGQLNPLSLTQQWNLGIQQEFPGAIVMELNYIGLHGVHNPLIVPQNLPDPSQANALVLTNTTAATQAARPFHNLSSFQVYYNVGTSSYNGLQSTIRRRFRSGVSFSASYTWSHAIDDGSGIYNYSLPNGLSVGQYPSDGAFRKARDRSNASFDVRDGFTANGSYTTKGPIWLRNLRISGSTTGRSGLPLNISQTNVFPGVTTPAAQRPNGSGQGLKIKPYNNGASVQYLQPTPGLVASSNFALTPSGPFGYGSGKTRTVLLPATDGIYSLGTNPRNTIYGPQLFNVNTSLSRIFTIHEKANFEFRVDAFNLLNHTNFLAPATALVATTGVPTGSTTPIPYFSTGTFGQITSAYRPRFLQIVTRINF